MERKKCFFPLSLSKCVPPHQKEEKKKLKKTHSHYPLSTSLTIHDSLFNLSRRHHKKEQRGNFSWLWIFHFPNYHATVHLPHHLKTCRRNHQTLLRFLTKSCHRQNSKLRQRALSVSVKRGSPSQPPETFAQPLDSFHPHQTSAPSTPTPP